MIRLLITGLRIAGYRGLALAVAGAVGLGMTDCAAAKEPVLDYPLYYRLGGMRATDIAASKFNEITSLTGSQAATGAVCGGFNQAGDVLDILKSRIEDSLTSLSAVPQAVSGALPGSILCRAKPGLCQLLQHYVVRAENRWNLSVDECQRDFSAAARPDSPRRDVLEASRTEKWRQGAEQGTSATEAKRKADTSDGCVTWLGGTRAGCQGAAPIWLVRDTAKAGWCLLMGQPSGCQGAPASDTERAGHAPLGRVWPSPDAAGQWVVKVLGDHRIQAGEAVQTIAGTGLLPQIDQLTDEFSKSLTEKVYTTQLQGDSTHLELDGANLVLSAPVIYALRDLPDRDFLIARLANEAALAQAVEQAFLARRLLLSGLMEPHIQGAGGVSQTVTDQVEVLEREIDRANWEMQARRQTVANTVLEILAAHRAFKTPAPAKRVQPQLLIK